MVSFGSRLYSNAFTSTLKAIADSPSRGTTICGPYQAKSQRANKILLVEGATDVKTVQQLLRLHKKDHEVVLLPLGGSQLINESCEVELVEIKRISENVAVLIDSERISHNEPLAPDRQAFVEICQKAGIDCHVLDYRATENYFPDRVVKMVKGEKYRALEPYELLRDTPLGWSKAENWRMAREMTLEELNNTDLGEFLASL